MKTYLIYYYIIPGCLRTLELSGNNYSEIKSEFQKRTGINKQNILKINYIQ